MRNTCFISIATLASVLLGLLFWVATNNRKLEHRLFVTEKRLWLILNSVDSVDRTGELSVYGRKDVDMLLQIFEKRSDLREVRLEAADISSKGLHSLSTMANLELLYLKSFTFGETEIDAMCQLQQLKKLQFDSCSLNVEELNRLKNALPQCVIEEM